MYPQGEQPEALWIFTVLRYVGNLVFGLIGFAASIAWLIHIVIYVLIKPPLSQFLNQAFVKLDDAWGECEYALAWGEILSLGVFFIIPIGLFPKEFYGGLCPVPNRLVGSSFGASQGGYMVRSECLKTKTLGILRSLCFCA
jgi:hypothetical protein